MGAGLRCCEKEPNIRYKAHKYNLIAQSSYPYSMTGRIRRHYFVDLWQVHNSVLELLHVIVLNSLTSEGCQQDVSDLRSWFHCHITTCKQHNINAVAVCLISNKFIPHAFVSVYQLYAFHEPAKMAKRFHGEIRSIDTSHQAG